MQYAVPCALAFYAVRNTELFLHLSVYLNLHCQVCRILVMHGTEYFPLIGSHTKCQLWKIAHTAHNQRMLYQM